MAAPDGASAAIALRLWGVHETAGQRQGFLLCGDLAGAVGFLDGLQEASYQGPGGQAQGFHQQVAVNQPFGLPGRALPVKPPLHDVAYEPAVALPIVGLNAGALGGQVVCHVEVEGVYGGLSQVS